MTARPKVPKEIETEVLVLSRRRCYICFGLTRETGLKRGQIAHLDHDPQNNDLDNLAFLCLDHHDQYDGRSSQSKNLTPAEVRHFRVELHDAIEGAWKAPAAFRTDTVTGRYVREGENDSAELQVTEIGGGRIHVTGLALWGTGRQFGPNLGELDFEAKLENNTAWFAQRLGSDTYTIQLGFVGDGLVAKEQYVIGFFGMNVTFDGLYRKI